MVQNCCGYYDLQIMEADVKVRIEFDSIQEFNKKQDVDCIEYYLYHKVCIICGINYYGKHGDGCICFICEFNKFDINNRKKT